MADLRLEAVTKSYTGDANVVDDVSFEVADGSFAVVVGPSGCGKSTTLRLIAGLEDCDAGKVMIGDRDVTKLPAQSRDVAVVFQNYALYPHMTVADNMAFGLRMRKVPRAERERLVEQTAASFGLSEVLHRYPAQLSGGQRQRVALGRATVRDPALFLLDEPLSNLDAQMRSEVRVELRALQQRMNATFVFVTHDQVEALTLADVIVVMRDGVLQQVGSPKEIYGTPANKFVATFIGSPRMNFFEGRLVAADGATVFATGHGDIPLPGLSGVVGAEAGSAPLLLGVRPEHLRLDSAGPIAATVSLVEEYGGQAYLHCASPFGAMVVMCDPEMAPASGENARFNVARGHEHLFDPATEHRVVAH